MVMKDIGHFLERNQGYVNANMFEELYDEAYEWLSNQQTAELTMMLSSALKIDAKKYAKKSIIKHFTDALTEFNMSTHDSLIMASFIRLFMNHCNGLTYDEFCKEVKEYLFKNPQPGIEVLDDAFDLYLQKH